ncbi:MAG: UDP-N-acetylmuramate--L-alanine ligase [Alphaproteobacteria bacterium]
MKNIKKLEPIHIVGIGGIGMSAIAEVLHDQGIAVRGSDQKDCANVRRLTAKGINVSVGHDAANVEGAGLVVLSSAVKAGNPELEAARSCSLPVWDRAEMLAQLMENYKTISVTGTHGKTTTTSMIAWIFEQAGLDPTVITGGIINAWGSNARIGHGEWMIVEADESDGTFVKLPTRIGVVTNIDPEHLDFYKSVDVMEATFGQFFDRIQPDGVAIVGVDHPVARRFFEAGREKGRHLLGYGAAADADLRLEALRPGNGKIHFDTHLNSSVKGGARNIDDMALPVPGHYNTLNAMAAVAVATEAGIDDATIRAGTWNGVAFYDDYAHHPAEIAAVIGAARGATRGRVVVVAQPHRYSRLKNLFSDFCECFTEADTVMITPVYTAGESPNGVDRDTLVDGLHKHGHDCVMPVADEGALTDLVAASVKPGDLVIGVGAGTITEWMHALPNRLALRDQKLDAAE